MTDASCGLFSSAWTLPYLGRQDGVNDNRADLHVPELLEETTVMRACLLIAVLLALVTPVQAQDRQTLGWGRLFTNDTLGDLNDRWQTGSYGISLLRGTAWTGSLPTRPGEVLELRAFGKIIAPENLSTPTSGDRRYAGALSLGLHTYFMAGANEVSLGGDLVMVGPQTRLGQFQTEVHRTFGFVRPGVLDDQIGNTLRLTGQAELGRSFPLGSTAILRPFVEGRAGDETLLRAGGDIVIGGAWANALMLRDNVTGQRYAGVNGDNRGFSLTLGADVAHVFDSVYLPDGGSVALSPTRTRLRAGIDWQGERAGVFYGLTYLGPEFESQDEGQFTGSLNVNFDF